MLLIFPTDNLEAFDLLALDNNVSAQWATGFAFGGTNMAIYSHVGQNTSTAVHEIAQLYGCRDYYLDLSGSLQDEKTLLGCRGYLGWADSDRNGVFDVKEP